jgi:predicted glycosyltransferase
MRVLFLPADGRGLGHVSRAGKLAEAIRGHAVCLVATGRRDSCRLIPAGVEHALVPGLDAVLPFRIPAAGAPPPGGAPPRQVLALRREFLRDLHARFDPDVIVTDQWPAGLFDELHDILATSRARKLVVFRPLLGDDGARAVDELGAGELGRLYDAILIASDPRTARVEEDVGFGDHERSRCQHIGYVSLPVPADRIEETRRRRGLAPGDRWIVCSVGSGFYHRDLIADCLELSRQLPDIHFDLVSGPGSPGQAVAARSRPGIDGRATLAREVTDLRAMHAAADIVICHGGYNTLTEAMEGGAALIVDTRGDAHRERARHVGRLQPYYPIACGEGPADLARHVRVALSGAPERRSIRARRALDFDGCAAFARLVQACPPRASASSSADSAGALC